MIKILEFFLLYHIITALPTNKPTSTYVLKNATQFESPWFALLKVDGKYCGGSLIQDEFIVTAAHCFESIKYEDLHDKEVLQSFVKVRFGEWKTNDNPDCEYGVDGEFCEGFVEIPPQKLIIHENYKDSSSGGVNRYKDDIALIKLEWPPKPSEAISSIELPTQDDCDKIIEDEIWTVTGFGHMPGTKKYSEVKKKIDMKMISHEECESKLAGNKEYYDQNTHGAFGNYVTLKMVCGKGTNGETTCQGDSGGGITTKIEDVSTLRGIVSFGVAECGTKGAPTGFVRVACYANWINNKISEL